MNKYRQGTNTFTFQQFSLFQIIFPFILNLRIFEFPCRFKIQQKKSDVTFIIQNLYYAVKIIISEFLFRCSHRAQNLIDFLIKSPKLETKMIHSANTVNRYRAIKLLNSWLCEQNCFFFVMQIQIWRWMY